MVAARLNHETVFTVLGDAARRRGVPGLVAQLVVSTAAATAIFTSVPQWWSLALLAGWSAAYAAWGLLARAVESHEAPGRSLRPLLVAVAAIGTAMAFAGVVGLAIALFTGTGKSPYNACGEGSREARCQAWEKPPVTTGPIIR